MNVLKAQSKTEALFQRIYPSFRNFPKAEQHALCLFIKEGFVELLRALSLAHKVKSKRRAFLYEADGLVMNIKTLLRLATFMKYLSTGFFTDLDLKLSEVTDFIVKAIKDKV